MTKIELGPDGTYLQTDDRREILEIIKFCVKNFERMKLRGQKSVTIFETRDIPGPEAES